MSTAFIIGSGIGVLLGALTIAYAQYLRARRPGELREPWAKIAALTGSPKRAAGYAIAYAVGWVAAAAAIERLGLGTFPRDDQMSVLLLLLTVAVLALSVFVVWSRASFERR